MASLARIAPDAVLHNVMPVFTFMGSNIFHRDDTYSFRVVQKVCNLFVVSYALLILDLDHRQHCSGHGVLPQGNSWLWSRFVSGVEGLPTCFH